MKTHVLIEVEGGTVTAIYSTQPINISIVDHDCKDEPEKLSNIYEPDGICTQHEISKKIKTAKKRFKNENFHC